MKQLIQALVLANMEALKLLQGGSDDGTAAVPQSEIEMFKSIIDKSCNWGVPCYVWDVTRTQMEYSYEGTLTPAQIGGATFKRTLHLATGKKKIPYYYAVCADNNLQACVLSSQPGGHSVIQAAVLGVLPKGSGLSVLTAKKKKWLVIDWSVVGRTFLGIKTSEDAFAAQALELFCMERHKASAVGPCEQQMVKEVDKRFRRISDATALDITDFFE